VGVGADLVQFVWSFGDGSPTTVTTVPGVSHAYPVAGQFSVALYVVDSLGRRSATKVVALTVQ
jgi:hypothetical protein